MNEFNLKLKSDNQWSFIIVATFILIVVILMLKGCGNVKLSNWRMETEAKKIELSN